MGILNSIKVNHSTFFFVFSDNQIYTILTSLTWNLKWAQILNEIIIISAFSVAIHMKIRTQQKGSFSNEILPWFEKNTQYLKYLHSLISPLAANGKKVFEEAW